MGHNLEVSADFGYNILATPRNGCAVVILSAIFVRVWRAKQDHIRFEMLIRL
jgi:hypothetical protein